MSKKMIKGEDIKKSTRALQNSDLQVRPCPMCSQTEKWCLYEETFYAARSKFFDAASEKPSHKLHATNQDALRRADCLECGFVAFFKSGFGPG